MVKSRNNPPRRVRTRRYTLNSRIPDQVRNLHRLVSLSDASCLRNLRMDRNAFGRLCYLLEHSGGLTSTKHVTVAEQVALFLNVIAHHKKSCIVKHDFLRSGRTVSKHFHDVLNTIYKMSHVFLAKTAQITEDYADSRWRWFKDCLGALDRTLILSVCLNTKKVSTILEKDRLQSMCLEFFNSNMQFIYVLPGWEGSAADSRGWEGSAAIHRSHGLRVPSENYYLSHANADGFLTPYRGVCYHLQEWDWG
ncbi:UNVERIFIED_CONTAM: hypothetical protein Slati_0099400 [Sesamum latifolium]|uniref:DUF8040 domain-containing protein n=1 Tax=Sesamum latifolium TaxID=2727402 RepID=A0AAW2Y8J0_9LAMI